jgi:putative ABC transport system permease protein
MLKNYLVIALRNLRRRPGYAAINVAGLAVGMACCLLIGLYARDELSFDRFHEGADRIATVGFGFGSSGPGGGGPSLTTPYPLAPTLEAELPEVESAVRTRGPWEHPVARAAQGREDERRSERRVLYTDPAFFEVFDGFRLLRGDPATALDGPGAAVITEETARLFFGDEDPLGQTLHFEVFGAPSAVTVGGVAEAPPPNSTVQFDLVAPMMLFPPILRVEDEWGAFMFKTYLRLRADAGNDAAALTAKVQAAVAKHAEDTFDGEQVENFFAVPLTSVYLSDLHRAEGIAGQRRYLALFGAVALFVLLLAVINYVNLVTAQSTRRAREVGVRKTLGAGRGQLARQFLSESVLLSAAALALAFGLVALGLPAFNALFGKTLTLGGLSLLVLGVGVAAGVYPAFVLSRFEPARVLRGRGGAAVGGGGLRRTLVVVQFAVTVTLLVGTITVHQQLRFMQAKDLGFDGDQVVTVELPSNTTPDRREAIRADVRAQSGVAATSVATAVPARFGVTMPLLPEEASAEAQPADPDAPVSFTPAVVDAGFVETLGVGLVAGRNFPRDRVGGERGYLLNEAAVRALGWTPEEAVGKPFDYRTDAPGGEVIGVVEDFHTESLHETVGPVILQRHASESWSSGRMLIARLRADDLAGALGQVEGVLARYAPDVPFEYAFLDDTFDAMYRTEERLARVFTTFAGLAVFIACLGLFGLAAFTAERRTKEIGIRKTFGASVAHLVALLTADFVKLVAVGFAVAAPLGWWAMSRWLDGFAYRVDLGAGVFAFAGALALVVAVAAVGTHAVRAAHADPVQSLRSE